MRVRRMLGIKRWGLDVGQGGVDGMGEDRIGKDMLEIEPLNNSDIEVLAF
jgi:hypothetical protein